MTSILDSYVSQIIERYKNGESTKAISKTYSVDPKLINTLLRKNDVLIRGRSEATRRYTINENYFDIIDTKEKAYILGLMYSDGCNFINHDTKTYRISIDLHQKDVLILEKISKLLGYSGPLRSQRNNIMIGLRIHNKHMSATLENIGMIKAKSLKLKFPNIEEMLISHFIRGYFDGDGSICKDNRNSKNYTISIVSTLEFCQNYYNILETELGICPYIRETGRRNGITFTASFRGNQQIKKFGHYIYNDSGNLFLDRKKNRFEEMDKIFP